MSPELKARPTNEQLWRLGKEARVVQPHQVDRCAT
jgi:hypothetical protein